MLPGIKLFDLTDRVAIITGGSKGLGEAMGAGLASAGANLMLVSRNAEEAQATAAQIAADYDCKAIGFAADVSQQSDMEAMAAKCLEEFGRIDRVPDEDNEDTQEKRHIKSTQHLFPYSTLEIMKGHNDILVAIWRLPMNRSLDVLVHKEPLMRYTV